MNILKIRMLLLKTLETMSAYLITLSSPLSMGLKASIIIGVTLAELCFIIAMLVKTSKLIKTSKLYSKIKRTKIGRNHINHAKNKKRIQNVNEAQAWINEQAMADTSFKAACGLNIIYGAIYSFALVFPLSLIDIFVK